MALIQLQKSALTDTVILTVKWHFTDVGANIYLLSHHICAAYILKNVGLKSFVSLQQKEK